jgi:hypothetical protein
MEWIRMIKLEFALVFQLCVGPYGTAGMILFLIDKRVLIFCRLFLELCIGYSYEPSYSRSVSGGLWILGATGC